MATSTSDYQSWAVLSAEADWLNAPYERRAPGYQLGRVSAAEYFQGAFGQKAALSAIEAQYLFRLVRTGTPS